MSDHLARDLALSRPIAAAERLGDDAPGRHRFFDKHALLTGDAEALATANGRIILLNALRLLVRFCGKVTVQLPRVPAALLAELESEAARVTFGARVCFISSTAQDASTNAFDAVLSVGGHVAGAERTVIASDGWTVHVDSVGGGTRARMGKENAVAALAASSLGAAEVFKRLVDLKPERGHPADGTPFSLYTYASGEDDPGPELPTLLRMDGLLVGFGAIGNGIAAAVRELPITGTVTVIDRQAFGRENLGTCVMIGPGELGRSKVDVAKELITSRRGLRAVPLNGDVETLISQLTSVPPLVLNALDNRDARRAVQTLWADVTVDGAIGDFMTQVSRHPGDPFFDVACLRCLYPPDSGSSAETLATRATGLTGERVRDTEDVVREVDVERAPPEKRDTLRAQLGVKICSVTSAAVLAEIAARDFTEDFAPSVPFVATMSAAMVTGEAVKAMAGFDSPLEPRFQFSALTGPALGLDFSESRHADCQCITRQAIIQLLRCKRTRSER